MSCDQGLAVTKTETYYNLRNNCSCIVNNVMSVVLSELDNLSFMNRKAKNGTKAFF